VDDLLELRGLLDRLDLREGTGDGV
jgi:hypothetical protein